MPLAVLVPMDPTATVFVPPVEFALKFWPLVPSILPTLMAPPPLTSDKSVSADRTRFATEKVWAAFAVVTVVVAPAVNRKLLPAGAVYDCDPVVL